MKVLGYDPQITVQRAWQLSSSVEQALSLDDLFARSDVITVHVPLHDGHAQAGERRAPQADAQGRRHPELRARGDRRRRGGASRRSTSGKLHGYVCDFPTNALKDHPEGRDAAAPRRSTGEAEENCAVMVADTLRDFLENGNIRN